MSERRSACCNATVRIEDGGPDFVGKGGGNVTCWFACDECGEPCEPAGDSKGHFWTTQQEGGTLAAKCSCGWTGQAAQAAGHMAEGRAERAEAALEEIEGQLLHYHGQGIGPRGEHRIECIVRGALFDKRAEERSQLVRLREREIHGADTGDTDG